MFVGDRHQYLAEGQALRQVADPDLLGRGFLWCYRLRPLQTASSTLDQQSAQVAVATAADLTQALLAAAGVLARGAPQPPAHLPAVPEVPAIPDRGHQRVGGQRPHAKNRLGTLAPNV